MSTELAGLGRIVLFDVRRSWLRMLIWVISLAALVILVVEYQKTIFATQAERDAYAAVANTPAVASFTGLPYAAATAGGILNIKLWMTNAIATALVSIFLVTRHGRADEELGRAEMLRAAAVGRHTLSVASGLVAACFALVTGLASAAAAILVGLPVEGSMLMGLSFTGVAFAFIGIAAITGQLASTGRAANSWAGLALALAYIVRAIADVNAKGETPSGLTWWSPIGWGQQTRSFGENQWWVLLLPLGFALACCGAAVALERSRDLGAGIVPVRPGNPHASRLLASTVGLPLRLQRTSIISWTLGVAVAAGFAVQSTLALSSDEVARGEVEWVGSVSRWAWTGTRIATPAVAVALILFIGGALQGAVYGTQTGDPGQTWRYAVGALAFWPTIALLIAFVAAVSAWLPRAAAQFRTGDAVLGGAAAGTTRSIVAARVAHGRWSRHARGAGAVALPHA